MNFILDINNSFDMALAVLLSVAYIVYVGFSILQLAVLWIIDVKQSNVSWWTIVYPVVVTLVVCVFNWEFWLLLSVCKNPVSSLLVWVAFGLLWAFTYWAYAYYPQMRRIVNRSPFVDNGPPMRQRRR